MEKKIDITNRTFKFAVNIIKFANLIPKTPSGFRIGGQITGSGTSIGANIQEAQSASSKKDFINKMNIASREARETYYWLKLLKESEMIKVPDTLIIESEEILKIITVIIKNTKANS